MKNETAGPEALRGRTKRYGLGVVALYVELGNAPQVQVMGRQFLRSGTSVGAHYREASRARSDAEFISKIETALQELDETGYWLELLIESRSYDAQPVHRLLVETDELIRIFVSIVRKRKSD